MEKRAGHLVLLRHGQSEWNKRNLFTGWVDVPLSTEGIEEAFQAGEKIRSIPFQVIFVSSLIRAQMTAQLALSRHTTGKTPVFIHMENEKLRNWGKIYDSDHQKKCIPIYAAWELNERMYGELQGMDKDEARSRFGADQVKIWRRSYDIPPPSGESLKDTGSRAIPYFQKRVLPYLERGEDVLISAHGNSLRSIVKMLEGLSDEEVVKLEIPTGEPFCYSYKRGKWKEENLKAVQDRFEKEELES